MDRSREILRLGEMFSRAGEHRGMTVVVQKCARVPRAASKRRSYILIRIDSALPGHDRRILPNLPPAAILPIQMHHCRWSAARRRPA